jgi:hypothetical protein
MKYRTLTCIAATVPFAALAAPFEFAAQSGGTIGHGCTVSRFKSISQRAW